MYRYVIHLWNIFVVGSMVLFRVSNSFTLVMTSDILSETCLSSEKDVLVAGMLDVWPRSWPWPRSSGLGLELNETKAETCECEVVLQ